MILPDRGTNMTRQSHTLPGFLAVAFLWLALPSYGAWLQDRKTELPTDEQKLLEYAQGRMNNGDWKEADRAYKAYLEKFPEGKNAENVYSQLGNLHHWYSHQYATSREWYTKACEKFPKSPNYWNYRFQIANTWQNQNLQSKAIEEYRKIAKEAPDASTRTSAIQQAWSAEGKYFYMHVNQSYTTGRSPIVHVQLAKIDKILFRAVHIKFDSILEHLGKADSQNLHDTISKVPEVREARAQGVDRHLHLREEQLLEERAGQGAVDRERRLRRHGRARRRRHDGHADRVPVRPDHEVLRGQAGLLRPGPGDVEALEGMTIRTLHAQKPLQGLTDANGLFVAEDFQGGGRHRREGDRAGHHRVVLRRRPGRASSHLRHDRPADLPAQPDGAVPRRPPQRAGQKLIVKPGEKMWVEIRDPKGNKVYDKLHTVGDFGSLSGQLVLGDEPSLGEYTILTRTEKEDANTHQWNWQWFGRWEQPGLERRPFPRGRVPQARVQGRRRLQEEDRAPGRRRRGDHRREVLFRVTGGGRGHHLHGDAARLLVLLALLGLLL
jgi:hypothetical protein